MTKQQKRKVLLEACELIESEYTWWSCNAIDLVQGRSAPFLPKNRTSLTLKYFSFYGKDKNEDWKIDDDISIYNKKHFRIMLLLNFMEGGI